MKAIEQARSLEKHEPLIPFTISGTGKQVRDVLHSGDLIALYRTAYEKRNSCAGEVFNIGGGVGNSMSLLELLDRLKKLLGLSQSLVYEKLPRRQSDQDYFVADISKAKRLLGWAPQVESTHGLQLMIEWIRAK
jgi:CDP-paratose 2-epimerase